MFKMRFLPLALLFSCSFMLGSALRAQNPFSIKVQPLGIATQLYHGSQPRSFSHAVQPGLSRADAEWLFKDRLALTAHLGFHYSDAVRPYYLRLRRISLANGIQNIRRVRTEYLIGFGIRSYFPQQKRTFQGMFWAGRMTYHTGKEDLEDMDQGDEYVANLRAVGLAGGFGRSWRIGQRLQIDLELDMVMEYRSTASDLGEPLDQNPGILFFPDHFSNHFGYVYLADNIQLYRSRMFILRPELSLSIGYIFGK